MATCPNCKKALSCGCQKRKASDGSVVCTNCISTYEKKRNIITTPVTPLSKTEIPTKWTEEQIKAGIEKFNSWKNKLKG